MPAAKHLLVLGIETSCDETGVALYDTKYGLLAHNLYSQIVLHAEYGGVVPELASRDHIRHVLPLIERVLQQAKRKRSEIGAVVYTEGPGLAGALLVGASIAHGLGFALGVPVLGVHHMEGHLLSAMLADRPPSFPFIALLVSGGHTQLMHVRGLAQYELLGESLDDAAGEAFDKTAKLLGLGYPGGPALAALALRGDRQRFTLPRPMLNSGDLNFSFSGLKTAVLTLVRQRDADPQARADIAAAFQEAIVSVLTAKSMAAVAMTGVRQLVVAGGVGANHELRAALNLKASVSDVRVFYPELEFCTDNGAMIAFTGALRLQQKGLTVRACASHFTVKPRWDLAELGDDQVIGV